MKKGTLKKSVVAFDEATHTYQAKGRNPQGITPIVSWVFAKTYDGIPEHVLQLAAEHGTNVHHACQLWDTADLVTEEYRREVEAYKELKERSRLTTLANEYTCDVYDAECGYDFASQIDVVFQPDLSGSFPLADIKTTSQLHIANVTLQLSIYAFMFEHLNKGKRAGRLFAIWLPKEQYGNPDIVEVQRIPSDMVEYILQQYINDGDADKCAELVRRYVGTPTTTEKWLPANFKDVELEIVRIEEEAKRLDARSKELRSGLLALMAEHNVKKYDGEHITLTRKEASTRQTLDTAKVKALYPEVYAECIKESKTSESLLLKIK